MVFPYLSEILTFSLCSSFSSMRQIKERSFYLNFHNTYYTRTCILIPRPDRHRVFAVYNSGNFGKARNAFILFSFSSFCCIFVTLWWASTFIYKAVIYIWNTSLTFYDFEFTICIPTVLMSAYHSVSLALRIQLALEILSIVLLCR